MINRNNPQLVEFYADGFRIGNTSVRIRNVSSNIRNSLNKVILGATTAFTLFRGAAANKTYFKDESGSIYYVEINSNIYANNLNSLDSDCNFDTSLSTADLPANFNLIKQWLDGYNVLGTFYRASSSPANSTLENCVINEMDNAQSNYNHWQSTTIAEILVPLFGLIALIAVIGTIITCCIENRRNKIEHALAMRQNEKEQASDAPDTSNATDDKMSAEDSVTSESNDVEPVSKKAKS